MQDRETQSLWSQITGECISGKLAGKQLTLFPASHTTYAEFKQLYPDGVLLEKPQKGDGSSQYEGYFSDREKLGIFGRANTFEKLGGKDLIFGLRLGEKQVAISRAYLETHGSALIASASPPALVTYNKTGNTVAAFSLTGFTNIDLGYLTITDSTIVLRGNDTTWDTRTGRTIKGEAKNLPAIPVITSFWFAWISFFPQTELIK